MFQNFKKSIRNIKYKVKYTHACMYAHTHVCVYVYMYNFK